MPSISSLREHSLKQKPNQKKINGVHKNNKK